MGIEAVEFTGGPADGFTHRFETDYFRPGIEIGNLGGIYRITRKALGCAWQAMYVPPTCQAGRAGRIDPHDRPGPATDVRYLRAVVCKRSRRRRHQHTDRILIGMPGVDRQLARYPQL